MGGPARVLVEDLPPRHRGDLGPFGLGSQTRQIAFGSQYRLGAGKTGPIRVNAVLRTKACETKPICRGRPAMAEGRQSRPCPYSWAEARQTNPISTSARAGADGRGRRWSGRWDRPYKRTQFGDTDKDGRGPAKHRRSRRSGRLRQTNPICPAPGGRRRRRPRPQARPSLGTSVPNEANSRWAGTPGRGTARSPMPTSARIQSVRNKPNRSGTIRRASALREMSYSELDTQQTSAKQSQFPPGPQRPRVGKAADDNDGTHRAKQSQSCSDRENGCQLLRVQRGITILSPTVTICMLSADDCFVRMKGVRL